jgi:hypothetical protein
MYSVAYINVPYSCIKLLRTKFPKNGWINYNFNIINMTRQTELKINRSNRIRFGLYATSKVFPLELQDTFGVA